MRIGMTLWAVSFVLVALGPGRGHGSGSHPDQLGRCEALVAELTRRTLFLELLKRAHGNGKINQVSYRAIWEAYHTVYSMSDLMVLDARHETVEEDT